jgi:t-SNARE complex subunit (syntaxin)
MMVYDGERNIAAFIFRIVVSLDSHCTSFTTAQPDKTNTPYLFFSFVQIQTNKKESLESLMRTQIRVLEGQLYNKSNELQEDICMKKFDLQTKRMHLAAVRAQVSTK